MILLVYPFLIQSASHLCGIHCHRYTYSSQSSPPIGPQVGRYRCGPVPLLVVLLVINLSYQMKSILSCVFGYLVVNQLIRLQCLPINYTYPFVFLLFLPSDLSHQTDSNHQTTADPLHVSEYHKLNPKLPLKSINHSSKHPPQLSFVSQRSIPVRHLTNGTSKSVQVVSFPTITHPRSRLSFSPRPTP